MQIRGIIFDCFHTVIDLRFERLPMIDTAHGGVASSAGVLRAILLDAGYETPVESVHAALVSSWQRSESIRREQLRETAAHIRMQWLQQELDLPPSEAVAQQLCAAHARTLLSAMEPMPYAREVLGQLAARVPLAMVSNFDRTQTVLDALAHFGLRHFFEPVLVSESEGIIKPDPDIFRRAAQAMSLEPDQLLVVGDQPHADVAGGGDVRSLVGRPARAGGRRARGGTASGLTA